MIFDIQDAWIDCACNMVLGNCSQDQVGALSPFEGINSLHVRGDLDYSLVQTLDTCALSSVQDFFVNNS